MAKEMQVEADVYHFQGWPIKSQPADPAHSLPLPYRRHVSEGSITDGSGLGSCITMWSRQTLPSQPFKFHDTDFVLRFYLLTFTEGGREGEKEEEIHRSVASHTCPSWGLGPATQACALTRN